MHIDLAPYLRRFSKKGLKNVPPASVYKIYCDQGFMRRPRFKRIYHDTEYSFILTKASSAGIRRDAELACIGFDLTRSELGNVRIRITQIQGVRGREEGLRSIKWERMLAFLVLCWAKAQGFESVEIQPGKRNEWYRKVRDKPFHMRYDVTARRLGFVYIKDREMYEMKL